MYRLARRKKKPRPLVGFSRFSHNYIRNVMTHDERSLLLDTSRDQ